jgi:hypothetical protein
MDVIIVCHTEFGFVSDKNIIFDKSATKGVSDGVLNLIKIADKYGAKISFAVCPEVVPYFPKEVNHEIGLHIHPGWQEFRFKKFRWFVGDKYLRDNCKQSVSSTVLRDFPFEEQFAMIKKGKEYLISELNRVPKIFVAGRWSENNNTIKALVENGLTHDCSAPSHSSSDHYDWIKIPRICMPYQPSDQDYQKEGVLPLLMVPISQTLFGGTVSPEGVLTYGLPWLLSCFKEYNKIGAPLFQICLHSPSMTDAYYGDVLEKFLSFMSSFEGINFKFASEIKKYPQQKLKGSIFSYFSGINKQLLKTVYRRAVGRI